MTVRIVFETHSTSEDNEAGIATGWLPGALSATGREQAEQLGRRRRDDGIAAVFCSDLRRAVQTAEIAFAGSAVPVLLDWRFRECDYGDWNGAPRDQVLDDRLSHLDSPYPHGESWRQAVSRAAGGLDALRGRWNGARVLVVGHIATRWALQHQTGGTPLQSLVAADFDWQPGWEYALL